MAAASLPIALRPRISALIRMLGSDHDGEALGAARALSRTLNGVGASLHDLADDIAVPAAPLMILQNRSTSSAPRRSRTAHSSPGSVELGPARRHHVVDVLTRASRRGALSAWENQFAASVITTLQGTRPRLSTRQYEIVEQLLRKFGESGSWA